MNRTVDTYERSTESVENKEGLSTSKFWKKERETKEKLEISIIDLNYRQTKELLP